VGVRLPLAKLERRIGCENAGSEKDCQQVGQRLGVGCIAIFDFLPSNPIRALRPPAVGSAQQGVIRVQFPPPHPRNPQLVKRYLRKKLQPGAATGLLRADTCNSGFGICHMREQLVLDCTHAGEFDSS
jgi:hypothetical protein